MKRKIYLFILAFLLGFATIGCQNAYVTEETPTTYTIPLTFFSEEYYDLSTGLRYDDSTINNNLPYDPEYSYGWAISAKAPIPNVETFTVDNLNFHYILFWKNSTFLGYYSVPANNASHITDAHLGTIASTTITPPGTATHWAIMGNILGEETPYTLFESTFDATLYTFDDIFSVYDDSPVVYDDWELWDIFDETQAIINGKYDYLDDTQQILPDADLRTLTEFGIDIFANDLTISFDGTATTESAENLYASHLAVGTLQDHLSITVTLESLVYTSDFLLYYVDNDGDFNDLQNFSDYTGTNEYTYEITDGLRNIGIFYYEDETYGLDIDIEVNPYVPYAWYTLDTAIYEGLSLRDIFETNNLVVNGDGTSLTDWSTGSDGTLSLIDGVIRHTTDITYSTYQLRQNINLIVGNYYFNYNIRLGSDNTNLSIRFYNGGWSTGNMLPTLNEWYNASQILSNNSIATRLDFVVSSSVNGSYFEIDNIFLINMSLFTTAPSQAQLDEWLELYLNSGLLNYDLFNDMFGWDETTTDYYYQLYQDSLLLNDRFEFYTFVNDATADEFDEYLQEYEDLLEITPFLYGTFSDNEGEYSRYNLVVDDVDNIINNFLADFGLGTFGKFIIFIVIIIAISVLLGVLKIPGIMILMIDLILLLITFLLGWIPAWVGILIVILLFAYLVMKMTTNKGGAD